MKHSELILQILKDRNISAYKIAKNTGLSESLFSIWKKNPTSEISSSTLLKIADYLGVSIDYLIGHEPSKPSIPTSEDILIAIYSECDKKAKADIMDYAVYQKQLSENRNKKTADKGNSPAAQINNIKR